MAHSTPGSSQYKATMQKSGIATLRGASCEVVHSDSGASREVERAEPQVRLTVPSPLPFPCPRAIQSYYNLGDAKTRKRWWRQERKYRLVSSTQGKLEETTSPLAIRTRAELHWDPMMHAEDSGFLLNVDSFQTMWHRRRLLTRWHSVRASSWPACCWKHLCGALLTVHFPVCWSMARRWQQR